MAGSKDRERELARRRYQRQLERRAASQAKSRQRLAIGSIVVAVLVIVGAVVGISIANQKSGKTTAAAGAAASDASAAATAATSTTSTTTTATSAPAAAPVTTPNDGLVCTTPPGKATTPQSYSKEPPLTIDTTATYTATITTNCGVIKAELYASKASHTVNSFVFLASKGYFTNSPCHRLTTTGAGIYVLQCGDPTGTGSGTPGYSFKDENLTGATYGAGVLAMANSGANTNGSQFFINYKDSTLAPSYTPFGKITQGLDIVTKIAARGVSGGSSDGAPSQPVSILSFTITKS